MLDATRTVERPRARSAWVVLGLAAGLVLMPSSELATFSGLPLDGDVEFLVALLVLPLMLSATVRRSWLSLATRAGVVGIRAVSALALAALAAKLFLLATDHPPGFRACYRSIVAVPDAPSTRTPAGACERSYDNPLSRYGVTRLDATIDFTPRRQVDPAGVMIPAAPWNLDFFNSNRFNFYFSSEGVPDRRALPFEVVWRGEIAEASPTTYVVRYVGEVDITIGDEPTITLPSSYDEIGREPIAVPAGRNALRVDYRFGRQLLRPDPPPDHGASIVLEDADGEAVRSRTGDGPWRSMSTATDLVTGALTLAVGLAALLALRWKLLIAPVAGAVAYAGIRTSGISPYAVGLTEVGLLVLGCWLLARRQWSRSSLLLVMFVAVGVIELVRAQHDFGSFDDVFLRPGGHDSLTYESQAHAVLGGSLRGEEDVFVYSPAFRYVLAGLHVLFGNGDARLSVVALAAMSMSVLALATAWWPRLREASSSDDRRRAIGLRVGFVVAAGATAMLITSAPVASAVRSPLSEFPTWGLVPAALLLTTTTISRRRTMLAAALVGVALTVRANQAPGLVVVVAIAALSVWNERDRSPEWRRRTLALALGCLLAVSLLPAVHNVAYGRRLVFFADSASIPMNVPLKPTDAIQLCCDAEVREEFWDHVQAVTVIDRPVPVGFVLVIRYLQLAWLASLGVVWVLRRRLRVSTLLVGALPASVLLPHLFLQVDVYYPRHIVLGYVVMGLAAAHGFSARRDRSDRYVRVDNQAR